MEKMELYNAVREVPANAQKTIAGGRLKGKTDINPMWRIKTLTEQFGICGIGWYYEITNQWLEQGHGGEIAAFCNINLYVFVNGEWSKPIPGTGGSAFVASEGKGMYTSDECYKMALTDAISVACKALGFGADIYWNADRTKYDQAHEPVKAAPKKKDPDPVKDVDPALLPGGDRFKNAVMLSATGQNPPTGPSVRDRWINSVHATPAMVIEFDQAVLKYKVEHNLM